MNPSTSKLFSALLAGAVAAAFGLAASCSSDDGGAVASNTGGGGTGATGTGGTGTGGTATGGFGGSGNQGPYADFPAAPEVDPGLPGNVADLFGAATDAPSGGPCLVEPSLEAMVPRNWTPLRFEWNASGGQNVFELRLSVENQVEDLVVYTSGSSYTVPEAIWAGLTQHSAGRDIAVTLRGSVLDAGALTSDVALGAEGVVHLAPVSAPGSVVYWTSSDGTALKGFNIGDPTVTTVLTPGIVGDGTTCVACHVSAPGGDFTFYTRDTATTRAVDVRSVDANGTRPDATIASQTALDLLARNKQSAPVVSQAHYSASDAVVITVMHDATLTAGRYELVWTDLHASDPATGWGILPRAGDARQPSSPTWWHDGSTVAYTTAPVAGEGVISRITDEDQVMDIYTVPFSDRAGGAAVPLAGASSPDYWEYYPVISPDDVLLAFNRATPGRQPDGNWNDSYDEATAEVFVVPSGGGTAVRLEANDAPECVGRPSPGLTNSWPRWAPTSERVDDQKYYWLVFSSKRRDALNPQLFVAAVVTSVAGDGSETIARTYPALYVTAQLEGENNHTPAWDVFKVPPPR